MFPPLLLWCERNSPQARKPSCQPQRPRGSPQRNPELTNLCAAYFVLPLNPCIKPAHVLTLKEPGKASHLSPTPPPLSCLRHLHLEAVEWHQRRTGSHLRIWSLPQRNVGLRIRSTQILLHVVGGQQGARSSQENEGCLVCFFRSVFAEEFEGLGWRFAWNEMPR